MFSIKDLGWVFGYSPPPLHPLGKKGGGWCQGALPLNTLKGVFQGNAADPCGRVDPWPPILLFHLAGLVLRCAGLFEVVT